MKTSIYSLEQSGRYENDRAGGMPDVGDRKVDSQ